VEVGIAISFGINAFDLFAVIVVHYCCSYILFIVVGTVDTWVVELLPWPCSVVFIPGTLRCSPTALGTDGAFGCIVVVRWYICFITLPHCYSIPHSTFIVRTLIDAMPMIEFVVVIWCRYAVVVVLTNYDCVIVPGWYSLYDALLFHLLLLTLLLFILTIPLLLLLFIFTIYCCCVVLLRFIIVIVLFVITPLLLCYSLLYHIRLLLLFLYLFVIPFLNLLFCTFIEFCCCYWLWCWLLIHCSSICYWYDFRYCCWLLMPFPLLCIGIVTLLFIVIICWWTISTFFTVLLYLRCSMMHLFLVDTFGSDIYSVVDFAICCCIYSLEHCCCSPFVVVITFVGDLHLLIQKFVLHCWMLVILFIWRLQFLLHLRDEFPCFFLHHAIWNLHLFFIAFPFGYCFIDCCYFVILDVVCSFEPLLFCVALHLLCSPIGDCYLLLFCFFALLLILKLLHWWCLLVYHVCCSAIDAWSGELLPTCSVLTPFFGVGLLSQSTAAVVTVVTLFILFPPY